MGRCDRPAMDARPSLIDQGRSSATVWAMEARPKRRHPRHRGCAAERAPVARAAPGLRAFLAGG